MAFDYAAHDAQMAAEIRQEVIDACHAFELSVATMRSGEDVTGELEVTRRQANNLRLLCTGMEDRLLDLTVQRFANYLLLLAGPSDLQLDDLAIFIDMMRGLASGEVEAAADEAEFVRSLPVLRPADLEDVAHLELEVLLVDPRKTSARFVARELQNCGFRISIASRSYEALEMAARTRPDLVITTAVLDEIDGVELCCMFKAASITRDIPLALLTSFSADDDRLRALPEGVAFLARGEAFSENLGDLLQTLQESARGGTQPVLA
ncbi:MAG: response regulator [Geminicoccaceae bacterium]